MNHRLTWLSVLAACAAFACGSSRSSTGKGTGGAGPSKGGSGGTTATGGVAGGRGGMSGSGSGGAPTGGAGGVTSAGGVGPAASGGITGAGGVVATGGQAGPGGASGCALCSLIDVPLSGRAMVYDATRGRLYVTVAGEAPKNPNTVTIVDPQATSATAAIVSSVPIGSDPGVLALSEDASTLWVSLNGALAMRKVGLPATPTSVGPPVTLPYSTQSRQYLLPGSMVPLPGAPQTIVAAINSSSGVYVFDNGVPRGGAVNMTNVAASVLTTGTATHMFGLSSSGFAVLPITTAGISQTLFNTLPGGSQGTLAYLDGVVYSGESGIAIDVRSPMAPVRVGQFAFGGPIAVRGPKRLLMVSSGPMTTLTRPPLRLRLLDTDTYTQVGSIELPANIVPPDIYSVSVAHVGGDVAAFLGFKIDRSYVGHLYLIRSPLIGSGMLPPGGTGGVGGGAGTGGVSGTGGAAGVGGSGGASNCPGCVLTKTPIEATYLVYDALRKRIYAGLRWEAKTNPKTVAVVDSDTGAVVSTIPLAGSPTAMAMTEDGSALWVGVDPGGIQKIALGDTPTASPAQALPASTTGSAGLAVAITAIPGMPTSIAVATSTPALIVFDDGVARPALTGNGTNEPPRLVTAAPNGRLFGMNRFGDFLSMVATTSGVTQTRFEGLTWDTNNQTGLLYSNGKVFFSQGEVIDVADPAGPRRAGKFAFGGAIALQSPTRWLMWSDILLDGPEVLRVLDPATATQIASAIPPIEDGKLLPSTTNVHQMVYLGGDRVAATAQDYDNNPRLLLFKAPAIAP